LFVPASKFALSAVPDPNVLFVNVCVPEFVVTVESISIVRLPAPSSYVLSNPVPATIRFAAISSIRSTFTVTAPLVTVKSVELNDAIPLLLEVASSAAIVRVPAASSYVTSMPSPSFTSPATASPTVSSINSARSVTCDVAI